MKVTLEFTLPDEQEELNTALDANKYAIALHDIYTNLRSIWKYEELSETEAKLIDRVRQIYADATVDLKDV